MIQSLDAPADTSPVGRWIILSMGMAAALLLPAAYNGFPLIFPDTTAYLGVSYGQYWTLDRSGFYGLALKPILMTASPIAGLWIAVALQAALIAAILLIAVRRIAPRLPLTAVALPMLAIILVTSLPWHVSQLMPDAMTGGLVLLVWVATSSELKAPGTALSWLGAGFLALVHYTHLGLFIAVVVAVLAALAIGRVAGRELMSRAVAAAVVVAAVASAHVAVNGAYFGRWSIAPMSPLFLFARLNEDGLVPRWLDRHCGRDAPAELCAIRQSLPRDSQKALWDDAASPLTALIHRRVGQPESWRWIDMLDEAVRGSIRDEPLAFSRNAVSGGLRQLAHFQVLDDECPTVCESAMNGLIAVRPALAEPIGQSRQLRGTVDRPLVQWVTWAPALVGQLLLVPMLIVASRKRDRQAASLIAAILVALIANALMAGALSDVHDRYQSRIVWLAPFAALWTAIRWRWLRPAPGDGT